MFLRKFEDGKLDVRPEGDCYFVLPAGKIGRVSAGLVTIEPGGANYSCPHKKWRQVFFILEGKGTLVLDGKKRYPIHANMVCEIPYDAEHSVVASRSGPLRYLYINDYSQPTLRLAKEAAAAYKKIKPMIKADLAAGQARMKEGHDVPAEPKAKAKRKRRK